MVRPERNKDARCVFVGLHEEPTVRLDSHPRSARACLAVLSAIFDYALNRTRLTVLALWAKGGSDGVGATPPRKHSTLSPGGVLGRRRINQDREHCKWLQTLLLFSGVATTAWLRRWYSTTTRSQPHGTMSPISRRFSPQLEGISPDSFLGGRPIFRQMEATR